MLVLLSACARGTPVGDPVQVREPSPSPDGAGVPWVGKEGVRTVSVTVLGETGFRGRKNWVKLAQRAVALA
jgi:hypothetical protein